MWGYLWSRLCLSYMMLYTSSTALRKRLAQCGIDGHGNDMMFVFRWKGNWVHLNMRYFNHENIYVRISCHFHMAISRLKLRWWSDSPMGWAPNFEKQAQRICDDRSPWWPTFCISPHPVISMFGEDGASLKFAYARNLTLMEKVELSCQAGTSGILRHVVLVVSWFELWAQLGWPSTYFFWFTFRVKH